MQEWWDGLAWIASLRRWIAPYAASFNTLDVHQALHETVDRKCGVVLIRVSCWVSKKVTSNSGKAEGGGGGGGDTIYTTAQITSCKSASKNLHYFPGYRTYYTKFHDYETTAHHVTGNTANMAPGAIIPEIVDYVQPKKDSVNLPGPTRARLEKAGIDLSQGYPVNNPKPTILQH